jgi:hypothetical protein
MNNGGCYSRHERIFLLLMAILDTFLNVGSVCEDSIGFSNDSATSSLSGASTYGAAYSRENLGGSWFWWTHDRNVGSD